MKLCTRCRNMISLSLPFHPVDPRQRGHHVSPLHNHNFDSDSIMRFLSLSIMEFWLILPTTRS